MLLDDAAEAVDVGPPPTVSRCSPARRFAQTVVLDRRAAAASVRRAAHPGGGAQVRLDGVYAARRIAPRGPRPPRWTTPAPDGATSPAGARAVADGSRPRRVPGPDRGGALARTARTPACGHRRPDPQSDRAEVDAKPELEIYADDVQCAHGNTVGALDEDALFYARSRGIAEAQAQDPAHPAFIGEVVRRIEAEPAARGRARWLERAMAAAARR